MEAKQLFVVLLLVCGGAFNGVGGYRMGKGERPLAWNMFLISLGSLLMAVGVALM